MSGIQGSWWAADISSLHDLETTCCTVKMFGPQAYSGVREPKCKISGFLGYYYKKKCHFQPGEMTWILQLFNYIVILEVAKPKPFHLFEKDKFLLK